MEQFRERGACVAAVTGAPWEDCRRLRDQHDLPFPVLSDPTGEVFRALGVYHKERSDRGHLPRPSSLVFGRDGRLFKRRIVFYFRPPPAILLHDIDRSEEALRS
jgi:peroxiredoxin